jgi:FAD/FMN-containing dehydrogenase
MQVRCAGCGLANRCSMKFHWQNWSGSLRFEPCQILTPAPEEEAARVVRSAAEQGRVVRVVGAGHSSSPLVETRDILLSLEKLRGMESHDSEAREAIVLAGTSLKEAGDALFDAGLALHNLGDVNVQTAVGAVSTGTHGSGKTLQNLASALVGGRMITARGEIREIPEDQIQAFRCSLGAHGIFTAVRLRLLPAFQLRRRELCTTSRDCMEHLDELAQSNRNFDFYWYPRSDQVKLRTMNPPDEFAVDLPYATVVEDRVGWSHTIISKERELKFEEMEYALPAEAGPPCFEEIRKRVLSHHRRTVAWRVLYRFVAADDAYLSTAHARETVTISLHHNAGMPYDEYFNDIEPIFRSYGGRPHWGKKHSLRAEQLRSLYPKWNAFLDVSRASDPDGVFFSPYLRSILGG